MEPRRGLCTLWRLLLLLQALGCRATAGGDSPGARATVAAAARAASEVRTPAPRSAAENGTMGDGDGDDTFLYFAYGSNLLAERIHINNPSAERVAHAKLKDYRLDFDFLSPRWGGHAATVVPERGRDVWGAVWCIGRQHLDDLDRQEGVANGVYVPLQVEVEGADGRRMRCRSYCLREQPPSPLPAGRVISEGRLPSQIYWQVIVQGARESGLPEAYIAFLESIPHNDYVGNFTIGSLSANLDDINVSLVSPQTSSGAP